MTKDRGDLHRGYMTLISAARRATHFTSETYQRYFDNQSLTWNHPITGEVWDTTFIGSPGHSASVGAFLYMIGGSMLGEKESPPPNSFKLHYFATAEDPRQNIVFAEASNEYESVMCGGMTDFSGEGRSALKMAQDAFRFLALINGVMPETIYYSHKQYREFLMKCPDVFKSSYSR